MQVALNTPTLNLIGRDDLTPRGRQLGNPARGERFMRRRCLG